MVLPIMILDWSLTLMDHQNLFQTLQCHLAQEPDPLTRKLKPDLIQQKQA